MNLKFLGILFVLHYGSCLYPSNGDVVELTPSNFDSLVRKSDDIWIVEFFAPWCGNCKSLAPEYAKAAKGLKGVVKVGAVNADEHNSLGGEFGVRGFPTITIFGANKKKPEDYNGARTADGLIDAAFKALKAKVNNQMGGKKSSSSGSSDVIELTDDNFDKLVLGSEDLWLVEFYAPWCGHCKNLAPNWAQAATELKGKVKLGALDATVHSIKAKEYGIQGYPTIKYFPSGKKEKHSAQVYDGGRVSQDIVSWALEKAVESVPAPKIEQITSESVFKSACVDHPLCVISILPNIYDCQSECRNNYLEILRTMGEKYRKKMWGWLWAEASSQPELEEALELGGFGYPAMAVISHKKMKYLTLRGPFSSDGINAFLRDPSYGKGSTAPIRGAELSKIRDVEPWDGKDVILEVEEDIDLSDVELDELPKDEL
ncbi:hypothetical protein QYM36_008903 [Artemia franciscana]|uniref:Protein disulfide-isomerase A6 homolog n=4 Tax=Artemia franciscana TaxID=6661 RepID=A0AA88HSS1_ARTSF|nr:hypothetical protein QYM36_008903 [Artemia franciscana]